VCKKSGRPESAIFDVRGERNKPQKSCRVENAATSKNQRQKLSTFNFENYGILADFGKKLGLPGCAWVSKNKKKIKKLKMNKESEKSVQKKWSTGKCHFRCARRAKRTSKIVPRQGCGKVKKSAKKTEHF